jgi:hypothetical protein
MATKRTGRLERICIDPGGGERTNMERAAPDGKERASDSPAVLRERDTPRVYTRRTNV